ncbi:MAG TPA: carbohydrate-binding protein [Pseudonocardiaceae bacterium]|jgi:hypothetical protein|nr:carbohydrate-binding protein [Pseudonocardiaceae bacterium]
MGTRKLGRPQRIWIAAAIGSAVALVFGVVSVTAGTHSPDTGAAVAIAAASDVPAPPAGWSTVFSDDFTGAAGTGLNTTNWLYDTGHGYSGGANDWGTGEIESMTNSTDNVYQDGNGHLVIKPIRDSSGNWTSGRVETQSTAFQAPAGGQMEMTASIQQPNPADGLGYWPAFWALGAGARATGAGDWPSVGELDTMEDVNALSEVAHTLHCGVDPGGPCNETNGLGSGLISCAGCQTAFHTYSVIVDRTNTAAEQLRFYTDNKLEYTINESQVGTATWQAAIDHGFFMILNLAIGGGFPNGVCGCSSPTSATSSGAGMSVDYVAVYQTGTSSGTSSATTTKAPTTTTTTAAAPTTGSSTGTGGTGGATNATSPIQVAAAGATHNTTTAAATDTGGGNDFAQLSDGAWAEYPNINFGSGMTQFYGRVASGVAAGVSGLVEVRLDSPTATPVGSFAVGGTGGWQSWKTIPANISKVTGTHTVYLTFTSGSGKPFVSLHWFDFGS